MNKLARKYARKSSFTLRTAGDEAVLVPGEGGETAENSVFALNEVGAAIWQLIEPDRDAGEIGRLIAEEFNVSVERASEDVHAFLILLAEKGLIEEV